MSNKNLDKHHSIRLNEKTLKQAKKLKINVNELFRSALDEEIKEIMGHKECPTCGQTKPPKKKPKYGLTN